MAESISIGPNPAHGPDLPTLIRQVGAEDREAFAGVYDAGCDAVFRLIRKVLRDHAQAEEVAQEVWVEVWRTAGRYRAERGSVLNWLLTLAHRRSVDRIRSVESAAARDHPAALLDRPREFDEVSEQVQAQQEREELRTRRRGTRRVRGAHGPVRNLRAGSAGVHRHRRTPRPGHDKPRASGSEVACAAADQ
ncbi:sigma factor [Streptomyces sp. NPDC004732]|uniref:sigma factor n=1 Tax=Streptomyces sp. NPDC004732 TaxID=3154290 RepID=UPI00339EA621